jgi:excisionase family DNA binding protein
VAAVPPSEAEGGEAGGVSDDRLLQAHEVADLLGVPKSWVRDATRDGRLPHVPLGRYRRYVRADILEWVEKQKRPARA